MKRRAMKWRAVGFVGVVLAVTLLLTYVNHDRRARPGETSGAVVLVATKLIPKGTPGSLVATNGMYQPTTLPPKEAEIGAVADPSYLAGLPGLPRAATTDILPGEQIIASDFDFTAASGRAPWVVLVATQRIPTGTPGSIVVENGMYRATVAPPQQREVGAISDFSSLRGRASVADIHLGQQLTEANFPARG
jgi:hypothetical protein